MVVFAVYVGGDTAAKRGELGTRSYRREKTARYCEADKVFNGDAGLEEKLDKILSTLLLLKAPARQHADDQEAHTPAGPPETRKGPDLEIIKSRSTEKKELFLAD